MKRMCKLASRLPKFDDISISDAAIVVEDYFEQYEWEDVVKFSGYRDEESGKLNMVTVQTDEQIAIFKKNESGDWKVGSCSPLPRH